MSFASLRSHSFFRVRKKKRSSAVAGKSVSCFETQVGAGVKTVGMKLGIPLFRGGALSFIKPGSPGETLGHVPGRGKSSKLLLLGGLLRRLLSSRLLSSFLHCHGNQSPPFMLTNLNIARSGVNLFLWWSIGFSHSMLWFWGFKDGVRLESPRRCRGLFGVSTHRGAVGFHLATDK